MVSSSRPEEEFDGIRTEMEVWSFEKIMEGVKQGDPADQFKHLLILPELLTHTIHGYYDRMTEAERVKLNEEMMEVLSFEIDRELVLQEKGLSGDHEISDQDVRDWQNERNEKWVAAVMQEMAKR